MIGPNPTRCDDDGLCLEMKGSYYGPGAGHPPLGGAGFQHLSLNTVHDSAAYRESRDAMAKTQTHQSLLLPLTYAPHKGFNDPWPRSPRDMKARDRVAMPGGKIPTTLSPLHDGEEANTLRMQPGILFAGSKI